MLVDIQTHIGLAPPEIPISAPHDVLVYVKDGYN
jgi:hypothetical protein